MTPCAEFKPLTKDDIADVLGISLRTIENWVNDAVLPAPKKLGNRVYWHPRIFYAWLELRLTNDEEDECTSEDAREVPATNRVKGRAKVETVGNYVAVLRAREKAKLDALGA